MLMVLWPWWRRRFRSFSNPDVTSEPQARPARPSWAVRSPYSMLAWLADRLRLMVKVLAPVTGNSGTASHVTLKVFGLWSNVTVPPPAALRSSQRPAICGGASRALVPPRPPSSSTTDSVKSVLGAPKLRLPLALTNTALNSCPQTL